MSSADDKTPLMGGRTSSGGSGGSGGGGGGSAGTVMPTLTFLRAVSWMFWAGFGAPWVLFAMIGAIVDHFFPAQSGIL